MTQVFLIRHGQTIWNKEHRYQGNTDIALSEEGLNQAALLANRLAEENVSAVYSSDLSRAFVTAEAIAQKHNLSVSGVPALREMKFGNWEGLTPSSIKEGWPEQLDKFYNCPGEMIPPNGETFKTVRDRALAAIANIVEKHPDESVVIVSHSCTIRTIICGILDIDLNRVWDITLDNTSLNVLGFDKDKASVIRLNDTHHLGRQKIVRFP